MTYNQMAERVAELRKLLAKNPDDLKAKLEMQRLLDDMHPGGW